MCAQRFLDHGIPSRMGNPGGKVALGRHHTHMAIVASFLILKRTLMSDPTNLRVHPGYARSIIMAEGSGSPPMLPGRARAGMSGSDRRRRHGNAA